MIDEHVIDDWFDQQGLAEQSLNRDDWTADGRRYRHLYIDTTRKLIGSRHSLGAIYTSQSVGKKQKPFWREWRAATT
jgi:hypothetical protein